MWYLFFCSRTRLVAGHFELQQPQDALWFAFAGGGVFMAGGEVWQIVTYIKMINYRCRLCRLCKHWKKPMTYCHATFAISHPKRSQFQISKISLCPFFVLNILVHQAHDLVKIRPSHSRNCHCQKAAQYVWEPKFDGERCGKKDVETTLRKRKLVHVYENIFWHDGRSWVTVWKIAEKEGIDIILLGVKHPNSCNTCVWPGDTVEAIPMPSSEKWFGAPWEATKMCKTGVATNNVSEKRL